jgi:hypothetical protein
MVVRPNLNDPVPLQILPRFLCGGLSFIRNQVVSRFRHTGRIDSEGDELSRARPIPDLPYALEKPPLTIALS